ncbi:hypothetical protein BZA77DRAFT_348768 [Pyronema omphalodes]|nr:hypothetical protein BZA77DRAFT_348768 [Pyronema omphalodes]
MGGRGVGSQASSGVAEGYVRNRVVSEGSGRVGGGVMSTKNSYDRFQQNNSSNSSVGIVLPKNNNRVNHDVLVERARKKIEEAQKTGATSLELEEEELDAWQKYQEREEKIKKGIAAQAEREAKRKIAAPLGYPSTTRPSALSAPGFSTSGSTRSASTSRLPDALSSSPYFAAPPSPSLAGSFPVDESNSKKATDSVQSRAGAFEDPDASKDPNAPKRSYYRYFPPEPPSPPRVIKAEHLEVTYNPGGFYSEGEIDELRQEIVNGLQASNTPNRAISSPFLDADAEVRRQKRAEARLELSRSKHGHQR